MNDAAPAGTAQWVRHVLAVHWGGAWGDAVIGPLTVDGAAPLTHTAGLWRVTAPDAAPGRDHVLKVQLHAEAVRPARFDALKDRVLAHCARLAVPVLPAVRAADGRPVVRHDGVPCELLPHAPGARASGGRASDGRASDGRASDGRASDGRAQAEAIAATGLDLREALDSLPRDVTAELADVHLPLLVDEEHWPTALRDALGRLLPAAERGAGDDPWRRAAARVLRELRDAEPLLPGAPQAPTHPRVVHGDLHVHHFLLTPAHPPGATDDGPARVRAVLDFDNLQVADPLLDLAWTADTVALACGPDTAAAREVLAGLLRSAYRRGLMRPGDERLLMPLLLAHSLPVIVDIAKDILDRDVLEPQWLAYFELLSPARRLAVHALLTDPAPH
ncbi:phosphotransferase [Streptomyces sp. NPDC048606]|uniref:phosphotransferase n=1 Tax=Streptomyces sp. NPDC048606 TaxID=3154726 RepID=UPI00342CDDD5